MPQKAIIAGAGGLIGSLLLNQLLADPAYSEVLILVRKELPITNAKLTQLVINFDKLSGYAKAITGDVIFCCLGSTRKKTPDLTAYRKIDHDYPLQLAEIAVKNGIKQFHLVSAIGANASSKNFYTRMKGETEDDIKNTGVKSLHIYQPSMLTGERKEKRKAEKIAIVIMKVIDPLLFGPLKKYRSIAAKTVAQAMVKLSLKKQEGIFIYPSDKIKELA